MRFAWYAGVSTALAASVVVSAFHQRANFYSAMVYLAQSNFCLLIVINFIYLLYGMAVFGLQRLLYGPLRQVEVEQLSEKAWFAITETCLAMTIFRDEIGAWFLVMFTGLITGKVWGWIGDGRVEILEQQPPTNPRLFHTRLSISLLLSLAYDVWVLSYTIKKVIQQARPDMMVMFLFEFAVLATCSARTAIRYLVSVVEQRIVHLQTKQRLEERRQEVRQQREDMVRQREQISAQEPNTEAELPREEDIDEMDIEVPGWENKGQWILILDLIADCTKLSIYIVFFFILFSFYGLPIHIMRDLFMTGRAVVKRGTALWKYRKALEDMNRYADATAEDLSREDTCIICREEMRPWDPANDTGVLQRIRPKKLPCGHILHMGCLKSWLERQQVCPTCRRSVVIGDATAAATRDAAVPRVGLGNLGAQPAANMVQQGQQAPVNGRGGGGAPAAPRNAAVGGARIFNFGALRVGFAQGGENIQELAQRMGVPQPAGVHGAAQPTPVDASGNAPPTITSNENDTNHIRDQLYELESTIQRQVQSLQQDQQQLQLVNLLLMELNRLRQQRQQQDQNPDAVTQNNNIPPGGTTAFPPQQTSTPHPHHSMHMSPRMTGSSLSRHGVTPSSNVIPAGSLELPEGLVIPPGWSLMPLQRLDGAPIQQPQATSDSASTLSNGFVSTLNTQNAQDIGMSSRAPTTTDDDSTGREPTSRAVSEMSHADNSQAWETLPHPRSITAQRAEQPEILAPNPVMPNWSGENQLFNRGNALGQGSSAPPSRDPSTGMAPHDQREAEVGPSATGHLDTEDDGQEKGKGKAKAATVEDAVDEESTRE